MHRYVETGVVGGVVDASVRGGGGGVGGAVVDTFVGVAGAGGVVTINTTVSPGGTFDAQEVTGQSESPPVSSFACFFSIFPVLLWCSRINSPYCCGISFSVQRLVLRPWEGHLLSPKFPSFNCCSSLIVCLHFVWLSGEASSTTSSTPRPPASESERAASWSGCTRKTGPRYKLTWR